jgi:N-acetylglucosaminyldiphosphoundecaprenol N-acetyl-beta-D-mannosaminyltransferase
MHMRSARILGVRVDCVEMEEALAEIERFVAERRPCRLVVTVNPEFVMLARADAAFHEVLDSAALCLADGAGVLWAARRQGCGLRDRVAGSDLVPRLAEVAGAKRLRLFFLGARPGVAAEAARRLKQANPGLAVVGVHPGSPRPEDDAESLRLIAGARPDILLVAYGAPQQELWIARNLENLQAPVAIGVGGAFDFLAGRVRRAPRWMRRAHLEWLYRLARQPWRVRRMAVLPRYAYQVIRHG